MSVELPASGLYALSDARGAGKSSLCRRLVQAARRRGVDVAGVFSPGVFASDGGGGVTRIGIEVEHIRAGERRLLAMRTKSAASPQPGFDLPVGCWWFNPQTSHWADQALAESCPCDVLIVDEIGPLELARGEGLQQGVTALQSRQYRLGIVVVRPELRGPAEARLPIRQWLDVAHAEQMFSAWLNEFNTFSSPLVYNSPRSADKK